MPLFYMILCDKNYFLSQALSHSFFSLQQALVLSQAAESALQQAFVESHACTSSTTSTSVASTSVLAVLTNFGTNDNAKLQKNGQWLFENIVIGMGRMHDHEIHIFEYLPRPRNGSTHNRKIPVMVIKIKEIFSRNLGCFLVFC